MSLLPIAGPSFNPAHINDAFCPENSLHGTRRWRFLSVMVWLTSLWRFLSIYFILIRLTPLALSVRITSFLLTFFLFLFLHGSRLWRFLSVLSWLTSCDAFCPCFSFLFFFILSGSRLWRFLSGKFQTNVSSNCTFQLKQSTSPASPCHRRWVVHYMPCYLHFPQQSILQFYHDIHHHYVLNYLINSCGRPCAPYFTMRIRSGE